MKPVIYARVSSDKQQNQAYLESQVTKLREFAARSGSSGCSLYVDEDCPGNSLDRPALGRLREDAKKKVFDTVLVHSLDRLSRDFAGLKLLQAELAMCGVKVIVPNRSWRARINLLCACGYRCM